MQNNETDNNLPTHVAIVMDGNGRWAKKQHLPRMIGHSKGVEAVRQVIEEARQQGIKILSLFAFSKENWQRPHDEIDHLMGLLLKNLQKKQVEELHNNNIRLRVIGDIDALNKAIQKQIQQAEALTENNTAMTVIVAINYSGQWDISHAACQMARDAAEGRIDQADITAPRFAHYLSLSDLPAVDLFIRTSGELRISNFFLWQIAYAELYFTDVLWPDFTREKFLQALDTFKTRQRRFGKVS
ncbi:MAG: isoprenyl transferase [Pseudomonadota bacterium]